MSYRAYLIDPRWWRFGLAAIIGLWAAGAAAASETDYKFGGFLAQGVALSDGNEYVGDSTDGSLDLYEFGLNGSIRPEPSWLISGQVLARRNGETDSGDLRLDYLFLDYAAVQDADRHAGIRIGRVKNPLGLYNEARDVIFTRPSISLPQSVYFEGFGFRDIFFSSDGLQLYGGIAHSGDQYLSLNVTAGRDFDGSDDTEDLVNALTNAPFEIDLEFENNILAQLRNDWGSDRSSLILSYVSTDLVVDPDAPLPSSEVRFEQFVLSGRQRFERLTLAGAYSVFRIRSDGGSNYTDGAYIQAEYRFTEGWSGLARYDALFADRSDRDGSEGNGPSHRGYARDTTLGVRWRPATNWDFLAEYHYISGSLSAPPLDNPDGDYEAHSHLFMLMGAWRFDVSRYSR